MPTPADCTTDVSIAPKVILNSILAKVTATGAIGLRSKTITAADADTEPVIGCAEFNLGEDQIIRLAVGLTDGQGLPCLIFIEEP